MAPITGARRESRHVTDPVCEMKFDKRLAAASSVYQNSIYYFCHPVCKKIFDADPVRFIAQTKSKLPRPNSRNQHGTEGRRNLKPECESSSSVHGTKS